MGFQATPYTIPLAIAAVTAVVMFALAATQRSSKGATTMMGLFGAMVLYAGGYAMQLSSTALSEKLLWHAVRFVGPALVVVAFFVFALQYTGRESSVTLRNVGLLLVVPVVTLVLVWTEIYGFHSLVLGAVSVEEVAGLQRLVVADGPWYPVHAVYSLGLTLAAVVLFAVHAVNSEGPAAKRSRLFALSGLVPMLGSTVYAAGYTAIDWGPVTYVVTGLVLVFAIFYY